MFSFLFLATVAMSQTAGSGAGNSKLQDYSGRPEGSYPNKVGVDLLKNIGVDQKRIWTSPIHLRWHDATWLVPFVGSTVGFVAYDSEIAKHVAGHKSMISTSNTLGNAGLAATAGTAGGMYLLGHLSHDEHRRETGYLSGLSLINGLAVSEVFKYSFGRQRPNEGHGDGPFFSGGASFFSEHSIAAWSVATVVANEYPGWGTKFLAYSAASAISLSRVTAHQHFPSDVIVGSTFGYLIGRQVYRTHHDRDLPGASIGTFVREPKREVARDRATIASPFVPMDSWVYPVFDRLMASGYIRSEMLGIRPWTRFECARLVREFEDRSSEDGSGMLAKTREELRNEFAPELAFLEGGPAKSAQIDSVYTRALGIAGDPLRDSYHFGSTLENDYGRPYAGGFNSIAGISASAGAGPVAVYGRAEYQYAPSAPYYSQNTFDQIQLADYKPLEPAPSRFAGANRLRLIEGYGAFALGKYQFSFGKQSLWWGPTDSPLLGSTNAEPITMFRVTQTAPADLPKFLSFFGKIRTELFIGRLSGHHFINTEHGPIFDRSNTSWVGTINHPLSNQPFIHGEKISFKPTPNFEVAFSRTGLFGGPDFPVTLGRLKDVYFSTAGGYAAATDPGDRRSGLDFAWRLPGLRKWATLYMDAFAEDERSPIGYWRQSAITPGFYIAHLPKLSRFDLRAEGGYTNVPGVGQPDNFGFFYWNIRYLDGYTNDGMVIGSTIPRRGRNLRISSTYWMSPINTFKLEYRKQTLDPHFLKGGSDEEFGLTTNFILKENITASTTLQYEWYRLPLLSATGKNSFTASVQLTYWPSRKGK